MFKVTLSQFGNVHNLEADRKRRALGDREASDEVFCAIDEDGQATFSSRGLPPVERAEKPGRQAVTLHRPKRR